MCVASALLFEDYGEAEAVALDWMTGEEHNNSPGRCRDGVDLAYASGLQASAIKGFNSRRSSLCLRRKEGPPAALDMQGTVYL